MLRTLGENIKKERIEKELSQEQLAEETGLHRTYISQLERGLRNPTITTLSKITKVLNVSLDALIKKNNNE